MASGTGSGPADLSSLLEKGPFLQRFVSARVSGSHPLGDAHALSLDGHCGPPWQFFSARTNVVVLGAEDLLKPGA
jgi:hypothetical protein